MANKMYRFAVYAKVDREEEGWDYEGSWRYVGDTIAVSESQAINNLKWRSFGNSVSQYNPISTDSGETWVDWRADCLEEKEKTMDEKKRKEEGEKIAEFRKKKGLTQREFGKLYLGSKIKAASWQGAVSQIERGVKYDEERAYLMDIIEQDEAQMVISEEPRAEEAPKTEEANEKKQFNLSMTPSDYEYVRNMSYILECSMSELISAAIALHKGENKEFYEKLLDLKAHMASYEV